MLRDERAPSRSAASAQMEDGQNGLARERLVGIQRSRMLSAMVELIAERGAQDVAVAHIVARSGVSRRTFYEIFNNREDCLLAALQDAIARVSKYVLPAYQAGNGWLERMRLALVALLCFLEVEPDVGRLLIVESLGAGLKALERRSRVQALIVGFVEQGEREGKRASAEPSLTAEGVVGGVLSVIHRRMVEGDGGSLLELTGPLMSMIVLPYLGPAASRRELQRPVPQRGVADRPAGGNGSRGESDASRSGDALRGVGMRLTYRTVCVLSSVGATPGSSNREIGVASGIGDQGQISKLLSRLERFGLVSNDEVAPGTGQPNAWVLTAKGVEVERTINVEPNRRSASAAAV